LATLEGTNFTSWHKSDTGTLYTEANTSQSDFSGVVFLSGDGYRAIGLVYSNDPSSVRFEVGNLAQDVNIAVSSVSKPAFNRFIGAYTSNDFAISANGGVVGTDTSGGIPVVSSLKIGRLYNNTLHLNGCIRKIAYYRVRVTNNSLRALTV
jgi:hypothetical protein